MSSDLPAKSRATSLVERLLRIPPEPHPPAGAHDSVRVFRAAPGFYTLRLLAWGAKQIGAAAGLAFGIWLLAEIPEFPYKYLLHIPEAFGIATFVAQLPATYLMVHLDYQLRWYIVTDRSLRIREGLVLVDEKTMSFANIQNISVRQGPLQRLLGVADVVVRSAGGGAKGPEASGGDMHLGYFRGVDNAEQVRDTILERVRHLKDSGLGDPDAAHDVHAHEAADAAAAARELLGEARALRTVVARSP
jgi:membrane protein YdbS with pleckstrin-like domain